MKALLQTDSQLSVVGRIPGAPGAYVAAITRGGYTHGPALGLLVADLIACGETAIPIDTFDPRRLAHKCIS
jgi:glycine/D-amino acid oxidase-like deaminating enzyme